MNKKLLTLAKLVMKFAEIETDKGMLTIADELAEGVEVFVEKEGEFVPAEDGEYVTDTQKITIKDGKIEKIEENVKAEVSEEFSRKLHFAEEGYNDLMKKIAEAVGENAYVVEAGDGWAIVSIWSEEEDEKFYRYTYSLDAEGKVLLGEREEVEPRFVTEDEAKKLDFEEVTPETTPAPDDATNAEGTEAKDAKIAELENKITELEGLLQDRDAVIAELTAKLKEAEDKAQAPVEKSLEMSACVREMSNKDNGALKFFRN